MLYLRISNPCKTQLSHELFTTLGVSTTRYSEGQNIGEFGSGFKHGILACLRQNLNPVIFNNLQKIEFAVEPVNISDGIVNKTYGKLVYFLSGKDNEGKVVRRKESSSLTLQYGEKDWVELSMALREFVSNALDRSKREFDDYSFAEVEIVQENQVRAKKNEVRVFVPLTPDVQKFYNELTDRFLHFNHNKNLIKQKVLFKDKPSKCKVYKMGVFVRSLDDREDSLFDYNFGPELKLDESRNLDNYSAIYEIARSLPKANSIVLLELFKNLNEKKEFLENTLPSYELNRSFVQNNSLNLEEREKYKNNFVNTWENFSQGAVACESNDVLTNLVRQKGFNCKTIYSTSWIKLLKDCGVKTHYDVIGDVLNHGRENLPPTQEVLDTLNDVWGFIEKLGMTNGKSKPTAERFKQIMNCESLTLGYYKDNCVYVHEDIASSPSPMLYKTVFEECAHHVTQSNDNSRDFQNYLIDFIWKMRELKELNNIV